MGRSILNNLIYSYKCQPVENFVFRLVTRWTVVVLLAFSFVLTCKLALGHSFACATPSYDTLLPQRFLEARCYSEGVRVLQRGVQRDDTRFPSSRMRLRDQEDDYRKHVRYYPWVNLVLLVQALVLHCPHLLWKTYECGYVSRLTAGLQVALAKEQKRSSEIHCLAKHLLATRGKRLAYSSMCVFFEVCNFVVCISLIVWLVKFFDVTGTGPDLSTWTGYRDFYFPLEGSCSVTMLTTSGERLTLDATCFLPLNELHMRIFLLVRAWYGFVTLATAAVLVYRSALLHPTFRALVLRLVSPLANRSTVQDVCHQMSYSDWVFLRAVQKSVTDVDFSRLLSRMLAMSQDKGPLSQDDDEEKSSIYEDSR